MNLPKPFVKTLGDNFPNEADRLIESFATVSPTSIRVNRNKLDFNSEKSVPWCDSGYYLKERPAFVFDPLFHAGCYYVQEASSMFLERALRQYVSDEVVVLDLCAAPGGKTTLALSNLPEGSFVVANEIVRSRAHVLGENLAKTGLDNYLVLNSDAAHLGLLTDRFDFIIADVPCSGEGMFRKDTEAIDEWSQENVQMCVKRQKEILREVWPALKPNGILIYSTCTYNREENEDQISYICQELGADSLPVNDLFEGIASSLVESVYAYRFFPHKVLGEGFFLSVVRKHDDEESYGCASSRSKKKEVRNKVKCPEICKNWLIDSDRYVFDVRENEVYALRKEFEELIQSLVRVIKPLYQPLHIASIKGKDLIPSHELALSISLSKGLFPCYELTYDEAVLFLKKEALTVSDECPKGFVLVTYSHVSLGFIKNIGNRTNNLYPNEWRIRTKHSPIVFWTVLCDRQL